MAVHVDGESNMAAARAWASRRREAIETAEAARAERREREKVASSIESRDSLLRRSLSMAEIGDQGSRGDDADGDSDDTSNSVKNVVVWDGRFDSLNDDQVDNCLYELVFYKSMTICQIISSSQL